MTPTLLKTLLAPALAALSLIGTGAAAQQVEGIAAVVNDEPITTFDVRNRMRLILVSGGIQPTEEILERIQEQAIDALIDESLQLQSAREYAVDVSDEEVEESLRDVAARNNMTLDQIQSQLAQGGVDIDTMRRQIRAEIAWQILVNGRYGSRIRISDSQIEVARERLIESASEAQVHLAEILVEVPSAGDVQAAQQRVQTIFQQLSQGAPFPMVAQQFSSAPSASRGGDIGWQPISQLEPQVRAVVERFTQPGQISTPIRVPGGFLIIALIDKREGAVVEQLDLVQVTLPASRVSEEGRERLAEAMRAIESCDGVEAAVADIEHVMITDLGTIGSNALIESIRQALSGLEPVDATELLETAAGLQSFVLCDRSLEGPGIPSPEQVERQLRNQQLSLLSRRWLRDLRRDATVEIR